MEFRYTSEARFIDFIDDLERASDALGWDKLQRLVEKRKKLVDLKNETYDCIINIDNVLQEAIKETKTSK